MYDSTLRRTSLTVCPGSDHTLSFPHLAAVERLSADLQPVGLALGTMDRYCKQAPASITMPPYGTHRERRLAIVSKSLGSPIHQTSLSKNSSINSLDRVLTSFRSFRTPRRVDPFHSLSRLPILERHRSLCTIPHPAYGPGDQRLPSTTDRVSTAIKHDVQGDAVAVCAMGVGTPRVITQQEFGGDPYDEAYCHCERHARGRIPGYQREVLLCLSLTLCQG